MVTAARHAGPAAEIVRAADRLFRQYGYRRTTVEDIARAAGMCRATVYLHFRGKEEIAIAWLEDAALRVLQALDDAAALPAPAPERIRLMLMRRILVRFDHARDLAESIDDLLSSLREGILSHRERFHAEEAARIAAVVNEGRTGGELHCEEPERTARLLVLATNSLLPYSLSTRQLGDRAEIEERSAQLVDLLLHGLTR